MWNCAIGALAHLGLARAYVLQGDTAKARAAYQDFLTLWKDADADIPVLDRREIRVRQAEIVGLSEQTFEGEVSLWDPSLWIPSNPAQRNFQGKKTATSMVT